MPNRFLPEHEWNLSYLTDPESVYKEFRRCAVLFEYGRENVALRTWIETLRSHNLLKRNTQERISLDEEIKNSLYSRILRESHLLTLNEIAFLANEQSFPSKPFSANIAHFGSDLVKSINGGTISKPAVEIEELHHAQWERLGPDVQQLERYVGKNQSVHIFVIPWEGTSDGILAAQFSAWLKKTRSHKASGEEKRGRNSGASDNANMKLNQLAAYRFDKAGITKKDAHKAGFPNYKSDKDWHEAIEAATARIEELYRPVAAPSVEG